MPKSTKAANLTQSAVLTNAAGRRYGHVLPLPADVDAASTKASKLLKSLLATALIEERPTSSTKKAWRSEGSNHYLLRITDAGREAVSPPTAEEVEPVSPTLELAGVAKNVPATMPGGKLGQVLAAVRGGEGASLSELIAITGWQPHSVRASLTRLRQCGISVDLVQAGEHKRYVAAVASPSAQ